MQSSAILRDSSTQSLMIRPGSQLLFQLYVFDYVLEYKVMLSECAVKSCKAAYCFHWSQWLQIISGKILQTMNI